MNKEQKEKVEKRREIEPDQSDKNKSDTHDKASKAEKAARSRSHKNYNSYYYSVVIISFVIIVIASVIYTYIEKRPAPDTVFIIDSKEIETHNNGNFGFKRGNIEMFLNKSLVYIKYMFSSELFSQNPRLGWCPDDQSNIPENYNFYESYPQCKQPPLNQLNTSSAYAMALIKMYESRYCRTTNQTIQLSAQHILSCDKINDNENGGNVYDAIKFVETSKIIPVECFPLSLNANTSCLKKCSNPSEMYEVLDMCALQDEEKIKREIYVNGTVITRFTVYTDFLSYKSGIYYTTPSAYRYGRPHVVQVIGWGIENGQKYWVIENTWGEEWGIGGLAKVGIVGKEDCGISQVGLAIVPNLNQKAFIKDSQPSTGEPSYETGKSSEPDSIEE